MHLAILPGLRSTWVTIDRCDFVTLYPSSRVESRCTQLQLISLRREVERRKLCRDSPPERVPVRPAVTGTLPEQGRLADTEIVEVEARTNEADLLDKQLIVAGKEGAVHGEVEAQPLVRGR